MKGISFFYAGSPFSLSSLKNSLAKLESEREKIKLAARNGYRDCRGSVNLPSDKEVLQNTRNLIREKKKLNPDIIVVIGIGGSSLGAEAIHEALLGKYSEKIFYADSVDSKKINFILNRCNKQLRKGRKIILNIISKSGDTVETLANSEIFINLVKKYEKDYSKHIVVTTDRDSMLWNYANKNRISLLEIPSRVGGRYSVFTPAGLFPLGMIGINIRELLKGAEDIRKSMLNRIEDDWAAISASISFNLYKKGLRINNLFIFDSSTESLGKWCRQLTAESLGKNGQGITPEVSIGSVDLHSMVQLDLGGKKERLTQFVKIDDKQVKIKIPNNPVFLKKVKNKPLSMIMDSIYSGVKKAYLKKRLPFTEIIFNERSAYALGQFMQMKMIETMYLGHLMGVNAFNQPNVEEYKREVRKKLNL